jgi:hypothetical protein
MEVALEGLFKTTILLHNFELWQLGLISFVLRDLDAGRVRLGFAKSRGLGAVRVSLDTLEIGYPGQFNSHGLDFGKTLYGVGALSPHLVKGYDFQVDDKLDFAQPLGLIADSVSWGRPAVEVKGNEAILEVLKPTVGRWAALAESLGAGGGRR